MPESGGTARASRTLVRRHPLTRSLMAWGPAVIWAAVLFLLSEMPPDSGGGEFPINDKVLHLGMYAVLGGALAWAGWRKGKTAALGLILLGTAYGALDEWHQSFVPGRDPSGWDFVADGVGVVVGFFLLRTVLKAREPGTDGGP